ncbi:MAG: hypothetical protein V4511_15475 [Bacteroidota bacterium]
MKTKIKVLLVFILLLIVSFYVFFRSNEVEFSPVEKLKLEQNENVNHNFSFITFTNNEELESIKSIKPCVFYSEKLSKVNFDFDKNNYLISFGREIDKIYYSWDFVLFKTTWYFSEFGKSIPVKVNYITPNQIENSIYIYSLPKKPYYRNELG